MVSIPEIIKEVNRTIDDLEEFNLDSVKDRLYRLRGKLYGEVA